MLIRIYRFLRWNTPLASFFRYRGQWPPPQQPVNEAINLCYPTHLSFEEINRGRIEMGDL